MLNWLFILQMLRLMSVRELEWHELSVAFKSDPVLCGVVQVGV